MPEDFENKQPLVSIFVPYYNDIEFLQVCINSILSQTYEKFELIMLNHSSTDNSREFVHSYSDTRIKHIDMPYNFGAGSGILMLDMLKIANGKYIKLFCADDVMLSNCVETLVNYLETNTEKDFVFADMEYVDRNLQTLNTTWSMERPGYNCKNDELDTLKLLFNGIGHVPYSSVLIKKKILQEARIDKSFITLIDMGIWASLLIKGKKLAFIDETLVKYRIHPNQTVSATKEDEVVACSFYESILYCDYFYEIRDIETIKFICDESPYAKLLIDNCDIEFIPFVLAHRYLTHSAKPYKTSGYIHLHQIMSDDIMREKIKNKFDFGLAEFRGIYSTPFSKQLQPKINVDKNELKYTL